MQTICRTGALLSANEEIEVKIVEKVFFDGERAELGEQCSSVHADAGT
jgi:hypothetical protein